MLDAITRLITSTSLYKTTILANSTRLAGTQLEQDPLPWWDLQFVRCLTPPGEDGRESRGCCSSGCLWLAKWAHGTAESETVVTRRPAADHRASATVCFVYWRGVKQ